MYDWIVALCFAIIANIMVLFFARARLVFRLRKNYPELRAAVGNPIEISRGVGFLWSLERHKRQLSSNDLKLLKLCLLLVYICMGMIAVFMILVFMWFPYTHGAAN